LHLFTCVTNHVTSNYNSVCNDGDDGNKASMISMIIVMLIA